MTYTRQTTRYIDILASLTRSPKTTRELAKDLGMAWYQALSDTLQQMRKLHIVRVQKWQPTHNACGMMAAVWTASPGIDAPIPLTKHGKPAANLHEPSAPAVPNLIAFAHVWSAMDGGKKTTAELAELSGFALDTIQRIVIGLSKARLIYIAQYEKKDRGGDPVRRFSIGNKPDAERPGPESLNTYNERRRIRTRMKRITKKSTTQQPQRETHDRSYACSEVV